MNEPTVQKEYQSFYIETARKKVLEVLFKLPEKEFSLTDLAEAASVSKANIGEILKEFHKIGFIQIIKFSNLWRIKANRTNRNFLKSKLVYNLDIIFQSGIIDTIKECFNNPKSIVLFGSFSKGEDISTSDIDIAVESDDFKEYQVIPPSSIGAEGKSIKERLQIHKFNRKNVDINVFNSIANGIVLWGFLEVKP